MLTMTHFNLDTHRGWIQTTKLTTHLLASLAFFTFNIPSREWAEIPTAIDKAHPS